jgi:hypothetical protein
MRRQGAVVGAPSLHVERNNLILAEIVTLRSNRVVMRARTVAAEKRVEGVHGDHVVEVVTERPSRCQERLEGIHLKDAGEIGNVTVLEVDAGRNQPSLAVARKRQLGRVGRSNGQGYHSQGLGELLARRRVAPSSSGRWREIIPANNQHLAV